MRWHPFILPVVCATQVAAEGGERVLKSLAIYKKTNMASIYNVFPLRYPDCGRA